MPSGCTLVIDSSSSPLLLALEKDGKIYSARRKGIKQEKLLFGVLQALLAKAAADLPCVNRVLVIRGPGRFTGLRIALTFASMMQMLNHTRVQGLTLFEVLREQVTASSKYQKWQQRHPAGALAVVLHAFREEYFLQIFDGPKTQPRWLNREELLACLAAHKAPLFVAGTDKNFTSLKNLLGSAYPLAAQKDCRVQARTLMRLSQQEAGTQRPLEPLYLKPARFELMEPKP